MQPTLQIVLQPGVIDLGWGHPDPALLPVAAIRQASMVALDRYGADMLAYGYAAGAGPLLQWLRQRIHTNEGRDPGVDGIMLTGGNSLGLDQACTLLARPGDIVLVESPTYHFAVRILRDHPFELIPIESDDQGLRVDRLEAVLATLQKAGRQARMLYCIPTFHNPTGVSLSTERRQAIIDLAVRYGLLIFEDDVYRDLAYDHLPPASLWSMDNAGVVVRFGSFAKSLAPGLRLGWLTADPDLVQRIAGGGVLDSGGGVNHFTALTIAAFCEDGHFEPQVERLRQVYQQRSSALATQLRAVLPAGSVVFQPNGGFFTWVRLPVGWDSNALLPYAEQAQVSYIPGTRFYLAHGDPQTLRLAHSLYAPDQLIEGVNRLGNALEQLRLRQTN